jgi:hypothetical protein
VNSSRAPVVAYIKWNHVRVVFLRPIAVPMWLQLVFFIPFICVLLTTATVIALGPRSSLVIDMTVYAVLVPGFVVAVWLWRSRLDRLFMRYRRRPNDDFGSSPVGARLGPVSPRGATSRDPQPHELFDR